MKCLICLLVYYYLCLYLLFFRGVGLGCNTREILDKFVYLKGELEILEDKERELDE